jgi:hypothetical protein
MLRRGSMRVEKGQMQKYNVVKLCEKGSLMRCRLMWREDIKVDLSEIEYWDIKLHILAFLLMLFYGFVHKAR